MTCFPLLVSLGNTFRLSSHATNFFYYPCLPIHILFHAFAQPYQEVQISTSLDPVSLTAYGGAASMQGGRLMLGAPYDTKNEQEEDSLEAAGAVYVLEQDPSGHWQQTQKLTPLNRQNSAEFGYSLNMDRAYAIVGSPGRNPIPGSSKRGAAIVFKRESNGSWQQTAEIFPAGTGSMGGLARQVDINGRYAILSAAGENYQWPGGLGITLNGAAYVFERDSSSENWTEVAKLLIPDSTDENQAGWSVAIWEDYAFLGTPYEDEDENDLNHILDAGAVHVFRRDNSGNWGFHQKLVPYNRNNNGRFGYALEVHDGRLLIGAPGQHAVDSGGNQILHAGSVYDYKKDNWGYWTIEQQLYAGDPNSSYGLGYAISARNDAMIIGDPFSDHNMGPNQGSVYIFQQQAVLGDWVQVQKIYESQAGAGHRFGRYGLAIDGPSAVAFRGELGTYHYEVCVPRHQLLKLESCEPYDFYGTMLDSSGLYEVEVEADWDCDSLTATVQFELVEVDTSMIHVGDSLIATASGATFQWMSCRSGYTPIPGATDSVYVPTSTGFYAVEVTQFDCSEISPCLPILIFTSKDNPLADQIRLYPNPSSGQFSLDLSALSQAADLQVYDATGRLLGGWEEVRGQASLDLQDFGHGPGLYVLRVQVGEEFAGLRVVWE